MRKLHGALSGIVLCAAAHAEPADQTSLAPVVVTATRSAQPGGCG